MVMAEVLRLLDVCIIYSNLISYSQWVSPTQVVLKKAGVTVIKNANDVIVATRIPRGSGVCND